MSEQDQGRAVLVGQDIFDVTTGRWLGSLKAWRPLWVHEGPIATLLGGDGRLLAVDLGTQTEVWSHPLASDIRLAAVGLDDVLLASRDEVLLHRTLDGVGREVAWYEEVEVEHLAHLGQHAIIGLSDSTLRCVNLLTGEETARVDPWPGDDVSAVPAGHRPIGAATPVQPSDTVIFPTRRMTFCAVTELERHYDVRCFDPWGSEVWSAGLEHTATRLIDGDEVLEKRLSLKAVGRRQVLFGPCGPGVESVLVRLADGRRTTVPAEVAAVVEDEEGEILGLLVLDAAGERMILLDADSGEVRWAVGLDLAPCNSATVTSGPHGTVIALFHPFQRDVMVLRVDVDSGEVLWRARQAIPRTSYRLRHEFNAVDVLQRSDAVVVRMHQAPKAFVRVLDPASGQCIFPRVGTLVESAE